MKGGLEMQPGINIEDVRKYNASLREYKDRSAKLRAEIEFSQQELKRQCEELSTELGIEVTPENVQEILTERIDKIKNTMAVGTDILNRIKAEEARGMAQPQQQQFTQQTQPVAAPGIPVPGAQIPGAPVAPQAPQIPSGQALGMAGTTAQTGGPVGPQDGLPNLPPIFAQR